MKPLVWTALCAGVITIVAAVGMVAQIGTVGAEGNIPVLMSMPAEPVLFLIAFLGIGGGPSGFPRQTDILVYILTFLLWWGLIAAGREIWTRLARAGSHVRKE